MKNLIALLLYLLYFQASAKEVSMNGIELLEFGDFSKWQLVTVRYRQDTQEMRFTYANDVAWTSLKKGVPVYPDGSVFAKIGFKTGLDPSFASSIVPSGARRFQLMVKDTKKYPETDGWGYALFTSNGLLFDGEERAVTLACHACHKVVQDRNFVFSEHLEVSPFVKNLQSIHRADFAKSNLVFSVLKKKDFQASLKKHLAKYKFTEVAIVDGDLRKYYFSGTLDEITPSLIKYLLQNQIPTAFVSEDQRTFKLIMTDSSNKACKETEISLKILEARSEWKNDNRLEQSTLCYNKNNL